MPFSKLEASLDEMLNKKAPFKLPESGRKGLAKAFWIIALVFGILELLSALWLWQAGHVVNRLVDYANTIANYYGGPTTPSLGFFFYISVLVMVVIGVMMLCAVPALKNMKKSGWDMLFWVLLLEALLAIIRLFSSIDRFSGFLWAVIMAVVGAYLLFQVRDYFTGKKVSAGKK